MKKVLRCTLWIVGLTLLFHLEGAAQGNVITGTVVTATDKTPLPGVTVAVKGQSKGTVTDADGKFSISAEPADVLVFSFIGMETKEISVGNSQTFSVELTEGFQNLQEVVVVGYGTQKKANLTGAVSNVDVSKTLESRPITDVGRALQGTTPGLVITTTSGAIGGSPTIKIRGTVGTIGGGSGNPLILVDNVEVPDLTYVNPDDIESISVLKDASTTAIYGARAAFGAILITTKKGRSDGKVSVSYSNNFSWATPTEVPEHTRADLNLQYSWDQINALRTTPLPETGQVGYYYNPAVIEKTRQWIEQYGDGEGLGREMVEGRDFDYRPSGGVYYYRPWNIHDIYYKDWTPQQQHNVAISGGNETTQYSLSGGYLNQKGILRLFDDSYSRLNASGFVSTKATKWLTVRGGFLFTKKTQETPFLYAASAYDPQYYLYRWHNVYPYGTYQGHEFRGGVNDLKQARPEEWDDYYSRYNFGTTLQLAKGLSANVDYTYTQTVTSLHRVGGVVEGINQWNSGKFENLVGVYSTASYNYAQYVFYKELRNTWNAYLTYDKTLGEHAIKVMGGTNIEDLEMTGVSAKREGVYDFDKGEVNLAGGTQTATSVHNWWSVAGFFGRVNYAFKDKYLFEANGRYDGSSKFAEGKRWGFFPSVSAAWRLSEESFMQPLSATLSSMKLRGSYGEVGNQDVPLNAYIPTLAVTNPSASGAYWLVNNNWVPYVSGAPALVDPTLSWETVTTLDVGLDAGFFNDKLGLVVDWYRRKTLDVLAPGETVPSTVGASAARRNFGELTTDGIEVALNFRHDFANGLRLNLSGQFTDYTTIVTKYPSASDPLTSVLYYEGKALGDIWGYQTDGLLQADDFVWEEDGTIKQTQQPDGQMKNTMADGVASQYILESGLFKFSPGDVRFRDLNGDGVIDFGTNTVGNPGDRTVIGNTTPRYQYGFRIGADWKGFDLNIFFQGVGKRSIWATGNMVLPGYYGAEANFAHTLDYWTPENSDAFYPRPMEYSQTAKWNYVPNDRYLLNMAYMRLKNLTFGYSLPAALLDNIHVQRVRVYFSGENLFEFDKLGGVPIDPELDWTTTTSADSRSFGRSYPYRRTLSFGLQVQL